MQLERAFHGGEAGLEFRVGGGHEDLGVDFAETREIDHREEQIAEFFVHGGGVALVEGLFELGGFLADFGEHAGFIRPVEADFRGFFLQF